MQQQMLMPALFTSIYNYKKELLLFAVTNGPASIILNWIFFGRRYFNDGMLFVVATLAIFPFILLVHNTMSFIGRYIFRRLALPGDTLKRIFFTNLSAFITAMAFILLAVWFYQQIPLLRFEVTAQLLRNITLLVLMVNLLIGSIYTTMYLFEQMKNTLLQNESLKKQQLQQQFDNLKTKVNPHFLFNSLSSLSMLVSEDTEKADTFLNEMSKVYRYMLRFNQQGLATLNKEMNFIRSYFFLMKTRYGITVCMELKTDDKYDEYELPSLSLQLLMDNAIQHNIALKNQPLHICIETNNNETLTVRNNLQKKSLKLQTGGAGLQTLKAKYDLLELGGFAVKQTDAEFMVTLPLKYATGIKE